MAYTRQTSALRGTAETLLDAASCGSRWAEWALLWPAPAAGEAWALPKFCHVPPDPKFQFDRSADNCLRCLFFGNRGRSFEPEALYIFCLCDDSERDNKRCSYAEGYDTASETPTQQLLDSTTFVRVTFAALQPYPACNADRLMTMPNVLG